MNQILSKDKILHLASRDKGLVVDLNSKDEHNLLGRLKIFSIKGLIYAKRDRNVLRFHLTKDTHLL